MCFSCITRRTDNGSAYSCYFIVNGIGLKLSLMIQVSVSFMLNLVFLRTPVKLSKLKWCHQSNLQHSFSCNRYFNYPNNVLRVIIIIFDYLFDLLLNFIYNGWLRLNQWMCTSFCSIELSKKIEFLFCCCIFFQFPTIKISHSRFVFNFFSYF